MPRRLFFVLPLLIFPLLLSGDSESAAAQRKLDQLQSDHLPAGTRITITAGELNAWIQDQARRNYPEGVRQTEVRLGQDAATGSALIDFGKIRRAQGNPPGWLTARLLDGERPVRVTAHLSSANGRAQVDVQSVEVSGVTIDGPLLDFLIRNFLLANYPEAKVGEPFELGHRLDRIDVRPAAVSVLIGR